MFQIEFDYQQNITPIQANLNESFQSAATRFVTEAQLNIDRLSFLSDGRIIEMGDIIYNIINQLQRQDNKMRILVISLNSTIEMRNNNENLNKIV